MVALLSEILILQHTSWIQTLMKILNFHLILSNLLISKACACEYWTWHTGPGDKPDLKWHLWRLWSSRGRTRDQQLSWGEPLLDTDLMMGKVLILFSSIDITDSKHQKNLVSILSILLLQIIATKMFLRIFSYQSTEQGDTRKRFPWILIATCESITWNYLKTEETAKSIFCH